MTAPDQPTNPPTDLDLPALNATPPGLYRHYKGGFYEVQHTVRCSETLLGMTLYRALYGRAEWWVRPAAMFAEAVELANGRVAPRFAKVNEATLPLFDLPTAHALVLCLQTRLNSAGATFRPPPPEPTTCCGRGCNGCVWEGYYTALHHWRDDALALLQP